MNGSALWLLARRKFRGQVRSQLRRLRRPSGAVLAILGLSIFGLWIAAIQFRPSSTFGQRSAEELAGLVRAGALFLSLFTIGSSLTHRGLFLPADEIERLLSAPLTRRSIVRYRLGVNAGRSILAGLVFGLIVMGQMPDPVFAFVGLFLAMQTLPLVGQASAILAGGIERKSIARFRGWPAGLARALCFALGMVVFLLLVFGDSDAGFMRHIAGVLSPDGGGGVSGVLAHPVLATASIPFEPWARMITAADAAAFLPWFGLCLGIWILLFEGTARLPIDFRELSLETSAHVAERIRRHRRAGGGASAAKVSKLTSGWNVPWIFGRGPAGAIAWRKATAILRKARGTVIVSVFVLSLVTLLVSTAFDDGSREEVVGGAVLIAIMGTFYLGAGLRFDFREDLDRMEAIKVWPASPRRVFVATLLPEVLVVALLEIGGILLRALATAQFDPWLLFVIAVIPLFVFAWIALDNAVFLFAPVRFVPGQEGALQNMGRSMVMAFVRFGMLAVMGLVVLAGGAGPAFALRHLADMEREPALVGGAIGALVALVFVDWILTIVGGRMFRRFDVARDRA